MGIKDTLRKAYFEIDWDDSRKIRIQAMKADIERVKKDGPALLAELQEKANANDADLDFEELDAYVRRILRFFCGEATGEAIYKDSLEYIGGGASGPDCAMQMVDVVVLVGDAWMEYLDAYNDEKRLRVNKYLQREHA